MTSTCWSPDFVFGNGPSMSIATNSGGRWVGTSAACVISCCYLSSAHRIGSHAPWRIRRSPYRASRISGALCGTLGVQTSVLQTRSSGIDAEIMCGV